MIDMRRVVGTHDIALITLDTLRFDVATAEMARGRTPNLARLFGAWEERHSPSSFTFAARFPGSETTAEATCVLDTPDIVSGLAARGYHTVCIGGVGFFNKQSPLGQVLPGMFAESHWSPALGVTDPRSTEHQVALAASILERTPRDQRVFLFVNVSALHQPNRAYLPGAEADSIETHAAALAYVDAQLPPLFEALRRRGPALAVVCSDHGTLYGEDGYHGHRVGHPIVWTVPYAEFLLPEIPR